MQRLLRPHQQLCTIHCSAKHSFKVWQDLTRYIRSNDSKRQMTKSRLMSDFWRHLFLVNEYRKIYCDTILSDVKVIKACQRCSIFNCISHTKTAFAAPGIYCHLGIQKCLWTKLSHEISSQKREKLSFYKDWDVVSNFKYCNLHASRQKQEACFGMLVSQLTFFVCLFFLFVWRCTETWHI